MNASGRLHEAVTASGDIVTDEHGDDVGVSTTFETESMQTDEVRNV